MRYCRRCGLTVAGQRKYCPLCQAELEKQDTEEDEIFPEIPTIFRKYNVFFRSLILASVIISVTGIIINILIPADFWWSFFVAGGIGCLWISMAIAISKRNNIPKNILYQVFIISVCAVAWDFCTNWRAWSVNYVIPITCTLAMLSMAIIAKVTNLHVRDYIIYLMIAMLFGIIPVAFILTGIVKVLYPSLICVAASIISLTALILFEGDNMRAELKRRLHL